MDRPGPKRPNTGRASHPPARRSSRRRILLGAVFLASVLVFLAAHLVVRPPSSYAGVEGPSQPGVRTEGVFRPGGYVDVEFKPGEESIKGLYRGSVQVRVVRPQDGGEDLELWPEQSLPIGKDWPNSFSGDPAERDITVEHRVTIPQDVLVPSREALMVLDYQLYYPVDAGPAPGVNRDYFQDASHRWTVHVPIELSDEPLTAEELEWMNRVDSWGGILNIVGAVAIVGAVTSPFMLLFGGRKK